MSARFLIGDTRDVVESLPDGSVDLVLTSPPFLALRSYLPADHPDKHREIGSEPTPAEFLATLLGLTELWGRKLAPHGSLCVELGDTYSEARDGYPLAKSLCGIPHLYHLSLAYGRNLLTGEDSPAGQWRVRNVVAWVRPNPPVGALGDKFRPATSYMTVACRARDRWFDLDAVRNESPNTHARTARGADEKQRTGKSADRGGNWSSLPERNTEIGAPPLDWWEIPTHPYPGSHYATWPPALCERPIEAMCPRRVCRTCGTPSRREVDVSYVDANGRPAAGASWASGVKDGKGAHSLKTETRTTTTTTTLGWTTCGCSGTDGLRLDGFHAGTGWRPGVVLDPFAGSGTTLAVATGHGRDAIGIDLDERNAELALDRVGPMLLEVQDMRERVFGRTLTVGTLFSGIDGLGLGLERAGMTIRWQSEIDPYCCRVLRKHWPDVPNLGDVTTIDWGTVERVDLIAGGYPCQPFSIAGVRRGESDHRHLWPYFADAIRALRPRYALLENVPGHLSLGFGRVLGDLAEIGYDAEWDCIPAAAVGAPHLRDRVFVVAYPSGESEPGVTVDAVTGPGVMVPDADRQHGDAGAGQLGTFRWAEPSDRCRLGRAWAAEPGVGRVADGVPARVHRLRALGNSVVPQVAEFIGRMILDGGGSPCLTACPR